MTGGGGAILRCSAPPSESCPTYDDLPAEITLLSATMTVGIAIIFGSEAYGWNDSNNHTGASVTDQNFTFDGNTYDLDEVTLGGGLLTLGFDSTNAGDIAKKATRDKLTLHVGSDSFNLGAGTLQANQRTIKWFATGRRAPGDSVAVRITGPPAERLRLQDHLDGADDGGATSNCSYQVRILQ